MIRSIISLIILTAVVAAQNPAASVEGLINRDSLAGPLEFLSHDLLEGRGVGTRADELSRLYIRTQMAMFGLQPAGPEGSFEQRVPIVGITAAVTRPLTAKGPGGEASFQAPEDYTAFAGRRDPTTSFDDAPLVFVGYGIDAKEEGWNDFKDVDVAGKVLLVMNNDPSASPDRFAGETRLYYGRWSYKYEEAARRGALGAIVIHTIPSAGYPFQVIQAGQGQEKFSLPFDDETPTLALECWCSEEAARRLCALGKEDLDALRTAAESESFRPKDLGVTLSLATRNTVRELESANVLGRIPGRDPVLGKEAVVVTAHFDHLGRGRPVQGDDIYNGALDNASGTSALLSLARAIAHLPEPPRRTILFAAVTAEESGLLGSLYFARNPTIPAKQMVANFNIDGINIWGPTRDVGMIGHGKNSLTGLAHDVAVGRGRTLVPDPEVDKGLFYRSDHFSFARIGVPSAYFKAGNDFLERGDVKRRVKLSYTAIRYHQPSDAFDARWNLEGAVEDTRLILECILRVADADAAPTWTPGDEFEKHR
jgi:Zn-dependent M28 family amino/carboxypeptidase